MLVALRAAPSRGTTRVRRRREAMISALAAYRARGRFPKNDRFATRAPFFVDAHDTRCAMAALVEASGERALVERIATRANNAYIAELAADAELVAWLAAHGLSLDEAARIQPNYTPSLKDAPASCGGAKATGVVLAHDVVVDGGVSKPIVERVWGTTALAVGGSVAVRQDAFALMGVDRVLVAVDASGAPVATPLVCRDATTDLEVPGDGQIDVVHASNDDLAGIILAPDCADRFAALAPDAGPTTNASSSGGGCMATSHVGGDAVALALIALVALRKRRAKR
jgi:hypothetical protein